MRCFVSVVVVVVVGVVVVLIVVVVVVVHPRNPTLMFGWKAVSNSWDIADIEFVWWWVIKVIFVSLPTFELSWGWVGVVTTYFAEVVQSAQLARVRPLSKPNPSFWILQTLWHGGKWVPQTLYLFSLSISTVPGICCIGYENKTLFLQLYYKVD